MAKQGTVYRIESKSVVFYTNDNQGVKKTDDGVRYGVFHNMAPYSFDNIRLLFKYKDPLLILESASKTISVSHWGNVLVDEYFDLKNIGSKVKGEWARIDYSMKGNGDNCMRQMAAVYPWYIQNMYFNDFIGNISSTAALRAEDGV